MLSSTGLAYRRCELVRVNGMEMDIRFLLEELNHLLAPQHLAQNHPLVGVHPVKLEKRFDVSADFHGARLIAAHWSNRAQSVARTIRLTPR